jgi:hypothetical protein
MRRPCQTSENLISTSLHGAKLLAHSTCNTSRGCDGILRFPRWRRVRRIGWLHVGRVDISSVVLAPILLRAKLLCAKLLRCPVLPALLLPHVFSPIPMASLVRILVSIQSTPVRCGGQQTLRARTSRESVWPSK